MEQRQLENLLREMTLEEKIGQMVQISGHLLTEGGILTGPADTVEITGEQSALIGSILNKVGAKSLHRIQEEYIAGHPYHIPLLMMFDVINGMETIFPIPLAQGCTFSPELVEAAARVAAKEAAVAGIHVTFSPMLDTVRDPRWGRVMESTGEDPWLNAELGKAMVRGYQGGENEVLSGAGNISGCIKHFAAYGAPEGGRDYDNVEISERTFREDYLRAYQAAVEEGCAMVMTSFNSWNRIPSSANRWLMRKVLREEMGFDGVVISDYAAVAEMVSHGIAEDSREAAKLAIMAGVDIDMMSTAYLNHLADLVRDGEVEERLIDEAVMRILKLKNDLGLFENPFKDCSEEKERELFACVEHRELARKAAAASFVLLKNEGKLLPLDKQSRKTLAFIGPYAENTELYGSWSFPVKPERTVTIRQGVGQKTVGNSVKVVWAKGCPVLNEGMVTRMKYREDYTEIDLNRLMDDAVNAAKTADTVVMCLGEHRDQTGEGGSRAVIRIPENQLELLKRVRQVNDNIVTVIFSGRPLEMEEITERSKAVLMVWMPGTEGGNAIADVLFGDTAPEGKLSMTLPRSAGQIPIYYSQFRTGRPNRTGTKIGFCNGYLDESTKPLYPFGFGLSYTAFDYSPITLSRKEMKKEDTITATVTVSNIGDCAGTETVQLYLRDVKGSVIRPMKMLRGVQKVTLQPGEGREVSFAITEEMLEFYDADMNYVSEPGLFRVFIGTDSGADNYAEFTLMQHK
ncbi:MAG: beta-glucosidase BglX [Lachnospiraceae bacterium]|nr:beta-glucosidase BglX [Lachnospiraceae bacterium]